MWPAACSIVYYAGIGLHAVLAVLIGQRFGLRARVPVAVSVCYLVGMTVGAKALSDVREGRFDGGMLLRRERFQETGRWGGPLVYLALSVPVAVVLTRGRRESGKVRKGESGKERRGRISDRKYQISDRRSEISERRTGLDLIALAAPVPMAVAKVACLCGGCCCGKASGLPWAIVFPAGSWEAPAGVAVQPTQVYDMIALLVAAGVLWGISRKCEKGFSHEQDKAGEMLAPCEGVSRPEPPRSPPLVRGGEEGSVSGGEEALWRGTLLVWFVGLYGVGRLVTEFTRAHPAGQAYWFGLTPFQWVCAGAAGACAAVLAAHGWRTRIPGHRASQLRCFL